MAEIGEPVRTQPLQVPIPQTTPAPVERPVEAPQTAPAEPEKVPA